MNESRSKPTRRQVLTALFTTAGVATAGFVAKVSGLFSTADRGKPDAQKPALKAVVVYYSATGNTAKIAKAIHGGLRSLLECDIVSLAEADPKKMVDYDLIGIGGPIWYFRETANLRLFAHKLPDLAGKQCFLFCAHGSEPIGFFASLAQMLVKRSLTIIGWKDWYGSALQVLHMPKPYLTDRHPDTIDVESATAFGRDMAQLAQRIAAGEKSLIPAIPTDPDRDELWINQRTGGGGMMPGELPAELGGPAEPDAGMSAGGSAAATALFPGAAAAMGGAPPEGGSAPGGDPGAPGGAGMKINLPIFDMSKCVYPRCTACEDGCPVGAIDFSIAVRGGLASGSDMIVSKACIGCSICERMCAYDACTHEAPRPKALRDFDMDKCVYPECTLCVDKCPMHCIDLESDPPVVRHDCEGCDLCWCLCPKDAISITNLEQTHLTLQMTGPDHPFVRALERYEKKGTFRRLVPIDKIGFNNPVYLNKSVPRIVLNPDPYEVAIYCDQVCKS